MKPPRRARVGVVSCYFPLFDAQMPPGFRQERAAVARSFAELLARDFEVVDAGMLASDEDGDRANATLREARLDAVVVAPTMAAPPSYTVHALAGIDAPVVVWNPITIDRLPDALTQSQATVNSSQVAAVMLANPFVRAGRPFATVTASPADEEGVSILTRTVRAAAAASALRGASVLRVGGWIPGYLDVESTGAELARLGVTEHAVAVARAERRLRRRRRPTASGRSSRRSPARGWTHHPGEADERSMRLALALGDLAASTNAVAVTVNCHSDVLRWNPAIGITACLGASLLTADGIPVSCTGDLPTALALVIARVSFRPLALLRVLHARA